MGCTFGGAVSERDIQQEEDAGNADVSKDEIRAVVADDEENGSQPEPEEVIQDPDNMMYEEVILYRQAESDKVCIYVEPSVLRDYQFYYYIPLWNILKHECPRTDAAFPLLFRSVPFHILYASRTQFSLMSLHHRQVRYPLWICMPPSIPMDHTNRK